MVKMINMHNYLQFSKPQKNDSKVSVTSKLLTYLESLLPKFVAQS